MLIVLYPVENVLNISSNKDFKTGKISIYNNLGQLVFDKIINNFTFNFSLENLKSGVYFYEIVAGDVSQKGKLIKN